MAKAAKTFHAYDDKAGRYLVFGEGDNVPDHVAVKVDPSNLSGKLPERPADSDPVVELRQSEIDALVAEAAGEKQFTQADLDQAAEAAREALVADLEALAADVPADAPAADEKPADEAPKGDDKPAGDRSRPAGKGNPDK